MEELYKCSKCSIDKPMELYGTKAKTQRGPRPVPYWCRECANAAARINYKENSERYKEQSYAYHRDLKDKINELKRKPCADCGIIYPPYVMDWDHLGDKEFNISHMVRRRFNVERIIKEIKKCELVCANCHRMRTHHRATQIISRERK